MLEQSIMNHKKYNNVFVFDINVLILLLCVSNATVMIMNL